MFSSWSRNRVVYNHDLINFIGSRCILVLITSKWRIFIVIVCGGKLTRMHRSHG